MKAYQIPSGARVRERTHYGADGQIPKVETGKTRVGDSMHEDPSYAEYPHPGEHAISNPSHAPHAGKSPSEAPRGHPNPDTRGHLPMPRFALGGSPGGAGMRRAGALGRAKEMLADRAAGHGATGPDGHPEGKAGNRMWHPETLRIRSTAPHSSGSGFAFHHSISLPGMGPHSGRQAGHAGGHMPEPPETKPDTRNPGGRNFPFGGGAMGGRGRDRTA